MSVVRFHTPRSFFGSNRRPRPPAAIWGMLRVLWPCFFNFLLIRSLNRRKASRVDRERGLSLPARFAERTRSEQPFFFALKQIRKIKKKIIKTRPGQLRCWDDHRANPNKRLYQGAGWHEALPAACRQPHFRAHRRLRGSHPTAVFWQAPACGRQSPCDLAGAYGAGTR